MAVDNIESDDNCFVSHRLRESLPTQLICNVSKCHFIMFIKWVLLDKVLKLYLVHKSKNRDFHQTSLQNALTRNLGQRPNTHLVNSWRMAEGEMLLYCTICKLIV